MDLTKLNFKTAKKKKPKSRRGNGFLESFREIGDSVVNSVKNDVIKGTAKGVYDQLINSDSSQEPPRETPNFNFEEWLNLKEEEAKEEGREEERVFQHAKKENIVFSLVDHELQQEIAAVRQELQLFIQTLGEVGDKLEKTIVEEIVNPGTYHLNFFQKIRIQLKILRSSLQDTSLWMDMWKSRSNRSHFWKMAKKKGTTFTQSHERTIAIQTG